MQHYSRHLCFFPWTYFGTPLGFDSLVSISCQIYFLLRNCHQVACPVNQQRQFLAQSGQLVATLVDKEWTIAQIYTKAQTLIYTHYLIQYNIFYIRYTAFLLLRYSNFHFCEHLQTLSVISTQYTYKANVKLLATET